MLRYKDLLMGLSPINSTACIQHSITPEIKYDIAKHRCTIVDCFNI